MSLVKTKAIVALTAAVLLAACGSKTSEEHYSNALALEQQNEIRTAIIEMKNAVQKEPGNGDFRAMLGRLHFLVGSYANAENELDRAIDLGTNDIVTRHYRLRTKLIVTGPSMVIGELAEEASLEPELAVVLGEAYAAGNDLERAKPLIQQGLDTAWGLLAASKVAAMENDLSRALRYASQAVVRDPRLTSAWLHKGEVELGLGEGLSGLASFQTAAGLPGGDLLGEMGVVRSHLLLKQIDQAKEKIMSLSASVQDYPPVDYLRGLVLYQTKDFEGAQAALREVQSAVPDHLPTTYLMGVVQTELGQINQATALLQTYIARATDDLSARKLLASLHFQRDAFDEALAVLEPLAQQTSDPQVFAMLGNAQLKTGQAARATESLMRAVELAPDMAPFRNQLAISLFSSGQDEKALVELENAISLGKDQYQSELIKAMYAARQGDFQTASESVEAIIAKNPQSPVGYNMKGALLTAQDQIEAGAEMFRKALELDSGFFPASENLARLLARTADEGAAQKVYEDALKANPDNEEAALALIDRLAAIGKMEDAITLARETVSNHEASIRPKFALSRLLLFSQQHDAAKAVTEDLLRSRPGLPDALLLLGQIQLASGDVSGVGSTARDLQVHIEQISQSASALAILGELQMRAGNLTLARQNLETAAGMTDAPPGTLMSLAEIALRENDAKRAQNYLQQLADAGVSDERIDFLNGETLLINGDAESAMTQFREMWEQGSRPAMLRYAQLLNADNATNEAVAVIESWLRSHPDDSGAQLALATINLQKGNFDQAKARYEQMLPTSNGVVLNNLAWIYFEEGDDKAEKTARQALAALPGNADILDTLGWILVNSDQHVEGVQHLTESAQAKPGNPAVQYHLSFGLNQSGQSVRAKKILEKLLSRNIQFPERSAAEVLLQDLQSQ